MLKRLLLIFLLLEPCMAGAVPTTIMVLGDSLSAGYGLDQNDSWVNLLAQRLERAGYGHRVINASISGDTTSGALARLAQELGSHRPAIVIVELGGNDGLRGLPLGEMQRNLAAIIASCRDHQADVVLTGMRLPPNYGSAYTQGFRQVYEQLARDYPVTLVPFLLEGLEDAQQYFQPDAIHPNKEAQLIILDNVWKYLKPLLK